MAIKINNSKFVRNLVKGHKLAPHLDRIIGEKEFAWEAKFALKDHDDAFHPSGDCVPTAAALYQATISEKKPPSSSLMKAFQMGHFWHAYLQWIVVERLGFSTWDEIEVSRETRWAEGPYGWARGSADIAPCHIPVHGDYLVDIKTMRGNDFKQQGLPVWCAAKYECQINMYMDWLDLDRAIILCVNKESPHDFKEFAFEKNQPLVDAIYSKWHLVKDCINQAIEPPENYNPSLPLLGPKL
jgi:hypothetical protein